MTFVCPGTVILIDPAPKPHIMVASFVRQGFPPTKTFGFDGIQVPAGTIVHGCGVSTPKAAAVADATAGFANDVHIPKGCKFTYGCISCIVPMGLPSARHVICDVT